MFGFLKRKNKKEKNIKIVINFNDTQLDLVLKILNATRNDYLKDGIMFDELNDICKKLFIANYSKNKKIVINEEEFNIIVNLLNKYCRALEEKNINTLELDYTILEIIAQNE